MPLLVRHDCALLLIDVQARLAPAIRDSATVVANAGRLAQGAALLGVPVLRTEQSPAKLGPTLTECAAGACIEKTSFDACAAPDFAQALSAAAPQRRTVVIAGMEAHICVLQTALSLRGRGLGVAVAADAVGSRRRDDHAAALARMARDGVEVVTVEMALFEWLGDAADPQFRAVSALVK
ncbi:MAG: isochorismatase family protein [Rubrimonas sp.]